MAAWATFRALAKDDLDADSALAQRLVRVFSRLPLLARRESISQAAGRVSL